jgi:hypothetical protein
VNSKIKDIVMIGGKAITIPQELLNEVVSLYENTISNKTIYNIYKDKNKFTNKQVIKDFDCKQTEMLGYSHRGSVEGIRIDNKGNVLLKEFGSITKTGSHDINIKLLEQQQKDLIQFKLKTIMPTMKITEKEIRLADGFKVEAKTLVKNVISKDIIIVEKDIITLPKGLNEEMNLRTGKVMEILG